jgi:hypothetical protein
MCTAGDPVLVSLAALPPGLLAWQCPTSCRKRDVQHTGTTGHGQTKIGASRPTRCASMADNDEVAGGSPPTIRNKVAAFGSGALIGTLGELIGLGGAEFRLPLLIGLFGFRGLEAVILNKATSLVVVATALPFRATAVSLGEVAANWHVIANLLGGSLLGAWAGAEWATRLKSETLHRVIAVLLVAIAVVLLLAHDTVAGQPPL